MDGEIGGFGRIGGAVQDDHAISVQPERLPMNRAVPVRRDGVAVLLCRVPLVVREAVAGIGVVQLLHQPVARDFRQYGRGGNRRASRVAVLDGALRHGQIGDLERIDEDEVRQRRHAHDGAVHRGERRVMDVEAIDLIGLDDGHAPRDGGAHDAREQPLALDGRHGLGVGNARHVLARIERDGAGHRRFTEEDIEWVVMVTRLRATGMPIRAIREYAELVRAGEGNEAERLALLEEHRERVVEQLANIQRNLELVDYKIGLYRERTSTAAG